MSQRKESLILMTLPYLSLWEKVFLAGLGIGLITFYSVGTIGLNVVRVSLAGLTVIYFLSSFKILEIPKGDNEVFGFKELLAWTIIPKIL